MNWKSEGGRKGETREGRIRGWMTIDQRNPHWFGYDSLTVSREEKFKWVGGG